MKDLGLIIIDEEQDSSYRQEESPFYHARDTAIVRGRSEAAVVVLGSATPSLESFHNAQIGKYRYVQLSDRIANRPLDRRLWPGTRQNRAEQKAGRVLG